MTLEHYIKKYEQQSKEKFKPHAGCKLLFLPNRGFCEIYISKDMAMVHQLCGDGKFWKDYIDCLCTMIGIGQAGTICTRNIKAYIRLFGFKIYYTETLSDGTNKYYISNETGKKGQCSPAWIEKDGKICFYVTWEV